MKGNSATPGRQTLMPQLAATVACALVLAGCSSKESPPAASSSVSVAPTDTAPSAAPPPAVPAPAVTQASWAPDALEKLVAPIALYPDQLVGQILAVQPG